MYIIHVCIFDDNMRDLRWEARQTLERKKTKLGEVNLNEETLFTPKAYCGICLSYVSKHIQDGELVIYLRLTDRVPTA